MNAIKMSLYKSNKPSQQGQSHFLGMVDMPKPWINSDKFNDEEIFLAQINLNELKKYDTDNILPQSGYMYIFLNMCHFPFKPHIEFYDKNNLIKCDFNSDIEAPYDIYTEYNINFSRYEEKKLNDYDYSGIQGNKLFGYPADFQEKIDFKDKRLLLQYDPIATENMDFLNDLDGYLYFVTDNKYLSNHDFSHVELLTEIYD